MNRSEIYTGFGRLMWRRKTNEKAICRIDEQTISSIEVSYLLPHNTRESMSICKMVATLAEYTFLAINSNYYVCTSKRRLKQFEIVVLPVSDEQTQVKFVAQATGWFEAALYKEQLDRLAQKMERSVQLAVA